jgi:N-acetylneuraminate synthase
MRTEPLFIWEMANNHNGKVDFAKQIIDMVSEISEKYSILSAIKFQYRDLETFIHKDYRGNEKIKHIKRFESTKLSKDVFLMLADYARNKDLLVGATPFDENSVTLCEKANVDFIKVASCSMTDWSLLDRISKTNKELIISTGGHAIEEIDSVVSFFKHKDIPFSLFHCVSLYPTENEYLHMNFIDKMKKRYVDVDIGYSGHEKATNWFVSAIAVAKGAVMFERHIGIENLNSYSISPNDAKPWVESILNAFEICGCAQKPILVEERENIRGLQRGVYVNKEIKNGEIIRKEDVYYAMPCFVNQTTSGDFNRYRVTTIATKDYQKDSAVCEKIIQENKIDQARRYIHKVKGMLTEAGIDIGKTYEIQLSHHYGFDKFKEYGAIIIDLINREYCKKLIIQSPKQEHPEHFHKNKEETFQILWGDMKLIVEGKTYELKKGDLFLVERYRKHSFTTIEGVIFEEISTTHIRGDSFYTDTAILKSDPSERKTIMEKP